MMTCKLQKFLTSVVTFKDVINDEEHEKAQKCINETNNFKGNLVLKGVLTLERLFNLQSKFRLAINVKMNISTMMHTLINLGTPESPKFIDLGKCRTKLEKYTFVHKV
jgi:hypothetical protein